MSIAQQPQAGTPVPTPQTQQATPAAQPAGKPIYRDWASI